MKVRDNHSMQDIRGLQIPKLKGHVKITLHNCRTGKNEVVEGDNIVTNAVSKLWADNYMGALSTSSMLSLWEKWFGGVLCFENAHPLNNGVLDPDDFYPQADSTNHLTAHAGQTAIDVDHDDDLARGNPVKASYIKTASSIKQVFEWSTTHGNGIVSALALTHSDVGSYGLGSASYHFRNSFAPFAQIGSIGAIPTSLASANSIFAQYDENHSLWFHISTANDYSYTNTLKRSGTKYITLIIRRLPYSKVGLIEKVATVGGTNVVSADTDSPTVIEIETNVTFYNQPSYYFDYENKKLWLFTNITGTGRSHDSSNIHYTVLDLSDLTNVTEDDYGTIQSDTANLAPTGMEHTSDAYNPSVAINANVNKIGNCFYFPTTSGASWSGARYTRDYFYINGFKKIDFTDQSSQEQISFSSSAQPQLRPYMAGGEFLVGSGYVCNGTTGYPCVEQFGDTGWNATPSAISWATHAFNEPQRPSSVFNAIGGCSGSSNEPRYIYANKLLLSTKYNLPTSIQKSSNQSMIVEYTLQEVASNE